MAKLPDVCDPARYLLDRQIGKTFEYTGPNVEVSGSMRFADENFTGSGLFIRNAFRTVIRVADFTFDHSALATATAAITATVFQLNTLAHGGIEYGFIFFDRKLQIAGLKLYCMAH
jgi:hypothetical protein